MKKQFQRLLELLGASLRKFTSKKLLIELIALMVAGLDRAHIINLETGSIIVNKMSTREDQFIQ